MFYQCCTNNAVNLANCHSQEIARRMKPPSQCHQIYQMIYTVLLHISLTVCFSHVFRKVDLLASGMKLNI